MRLARLLYYYVLTTNEPLFLELQMAEGVFTAVSGATARQTQLDTVSHNLANANTAGFRARKVAFEERMADEMGLARQVQAGEQRVDHTPGTYETTGNPLDVAIQGRGFFMVESQNGKALTRDGRFQLTPEGQLVTGRGEAVLNQSGSPIYVPGNADELMIDESGGISDAFGFIDQVGLYDVDNLDDMQPLGSGRFVADGAQPAQDATVQQSMLEGANVDPVEGMTELITLQRHFDAMQRLIQTHRDLDRRSAKLGTVNG